MLYETLDEIGKTRIRLCLQQDLFNSKMLIDDIISKVVVKLKYHLDVNPNILDSNLMEFKYSYKRELSLLCESLLHFLLTASTIPSSRKVLLKKQELDIVIPEVRTLKTAPEKSLIIKFKRDDCLSFSSIDDIFNIQPFKKNIWIVSPIEIKSHYKNYILFKKEEFETYLQKKEYPEFPKFSNRYKNNEKKNNIKNNDQNFCNSCSFNTILLDIEKFLKDSKNKSLRFFHA